MNATKDKLDSKKIISVIDFMKWVGSLQGRIILYRGQSCSNWGITTSASQFLERGSNSTSDNSITSEDTEGSLREILHNVDLIDKYRMQDLCENLNSDIARTDLGILAQLQHEGSATSLIDFTANPLVALWFACQKWPDSEEVESKEEGQGGRVFAIYVDQPSEFEEINSLDKLNRNIGDIIGGKKTIYWKPAHINNRIIAQGSFFVMGGNIKETSKFFVPDEDKERILEDLHQRYNITEISLFPDSSGFAKANSNASVYSKTIFDSWEDGYKLHSKGLYKEAIKVYQKIIDNNSYSKERKGPAYHFKALALFEQGEFECAIVNYNLAIESNPKDYPAYINLGWAKCQVEEYDTAIEVYNNLIDILDFKNWQGYNNRGLVKYKKGRKRSDIKCFDEAIKDYNKALTINPYSAEVYTNRGNANLFKEQHVSAMEDYNKALKYDPYNAERYGNLGRVQYHLGKLDESIKSFDRAIEINDKLYLVYRYRGDAFAALKTYNQAIKDYEYALHNNSNDWHCRYNIANVKYQLALINKEQQDMGKYRNSLIILEQADRMIMGSNKVEHEYQSDIDILVNKIEELRKDLSNKKD